MVSALCRLVGEVEHARAEGLRVDELQRLLLIAPVLKETLSAPHDATLRYSGGLSKPPPARYISHRTTSSTTASVPLLTASQRRKQCPL